MVCIVLQFKHVSIAHEGRAAFGIQLCLGVLCFLTLNVSTMRRHSLSLNYRGRSLGLAVA